MMFGSLFYNFWGALIAFTIYFFATFQSYLPLRVLIGSFIVGIIAFFAMFLVRYFIGFVMYTPDNDLFEQFEQENEEEPQPVGDEQQMQTNNTETNVTSTVEFEDENSEEIAKVVRTMIHQDDTASSNT